MIQRDTIVAAATPPGKGGVAVVRVSGEDVPSIARTLLGAVPPARRSSFSCWHEADGTLIDAGLTVFFPRPQSYTGEHTLELHGHANPIVVEQLIDRIVGLGARRARPGEFTERAFLNDKIDLAQAEAIGDLIDAGSRRAAQAAMRSMQGEFSGRINSASAALTGLRVYVEAAIDFPEEEIDFLGSQEMRERLQDVQRRLAEVLRAAEQGAVLARGLNIAIAGRPNAGKSTLMNALAGHDVAIVTPVAGTTRDLLRERIQIEGVPMELVDTAGLRAQTKDAIEAEGMRRAREALAKADHLLFLVDSAKDPHLRAFDEERARLPKGVPVTVVLNKIDLVAGKAANGRSANGKGTNGKGRIAAAAEVRTPEGAAALLPISATTGAGVDALRAHLAALAGNADEGGAFSARARHVHALRRSAAHLEVASGQLAAKQGELAALELREAQRVLGEVVGDVSSDELLGEIFGSFCIGK